MYFFLELEVFLFYFGKEIKHYISLYKATCSTCGI